MNGETHPGARAWGTALLALGVLAWVPFFVLVVAGARPPLYPFLLAHLSGVIGGSRLRAYGAGSHGPRRPRRQVAGRILIMLGVLAWAPYLYRENVLGQVVAMRPYLALHLTGVLSGFALLLTLPLTRYWQTRRP